ncbi:MAG: putative molybdenum carrier protein [Pirellulales bacterium]|nr:putative molybdenum carrier protein [Pirellulales bacterium]
MLRIISGGQTGVDRGALDAAIALGIPYGGWCPRGRLAEDGQIPKRYRLTETDSPAYRVRTKQNVLDSDATLVLCRGRPRGGTELTIRLAERYERPHRIVDLNRPVSPREISDWLKSERVRILNIAGPRESQCPGIAVQTQEFLGAVFAGLSEQT